MNEKERILLIEKANELYCLVQEHVHDIGDIACMIEDLNHIRKVHEKRLVRDCNKLSDIINNTDLSKDLTKEYIDDINEAISYANEIYVKDN